MDKSLTVNMHLENRVNFHFMPTLNAVRIIAENGGKIGIKCMRNFNTVIPVEIP